MGSYGHSGVDPVRKTAPKNQNPWRLFKGDDLTYPVEMFIHIMEFKNAQPGQTGLNPEDATPLDGSDPETKLIKSVLNHIPDPKYTDKNAVMGGDTDPEASMNVPASMWKHSVVRDGLDLQGWSTVKANLMSAFGQGEKDYTLKEKLALLQSIGKGPYEDSQAYLVRIRCLVSLLAYNKIPESITDLPGVNDAWVRVLFLFGLDDIEQNLLVEEADMKGLEELCNVLALPEVKMIRRADDDMRQHEKKEEKKEKSGKKRKAKENHHTTNDDFDEDMPLAKKHVKMEKVEDQDGYFDVKNVKVEPTLGEIDEREDQDFWGDEGFLPLAPWDEDETKDEKKEEDDPDFKPVKPKKKMGRPRKGEVREKIIRKPRVLPEKSCAFCDETGFKTLAALRKHQNEFHDGYADKCDQCDIKFNKPADKKAHDNKFHGEKREKKKTGAKKSVYKEISRQIEETYKDTCDGPIHQIPEAKMRDPDTDGVIGWRCAICNTEETEFKKTESVEGWTISGEGAKESASKSAKKRYEEHCNDLHQGKKFLCHLCPFPCTDSRDLVQHLWITHSVKAVDSRGNSMATFLKCSFKTDKGVDCQYRRTSNNWNSMGHHVARVHMKILPKKLSCTEGGCGQEFILFLDFHEHMWSKHEIQPIPTFDNCFNRNNEFDTFSCHLCVFKTCAQKLLDQHITVNHTKGVNKVKGFQCFDCGKMFTTIRVLKVHWETQHAEANLTCEQCPESPSKKKLYSKLSLMKHKMHMHRRNEQCSRCDRTFPIISKLILHFREQHLKYRRYQCKVCNNKLSTLSNARYHYIETHCKDMRGDGKVRMNKLPESYWYDNDVIQDLCDQDPQYPKDDYIKALVVAENQMNVQRETQRETPMEPSAVEQRLLKQAEEASASVKSIQVANPLLFKTNPFDRQPNPFDRHHHPQN